MDERWRKAIRDAESAERLFELAQAEGVDLCEEKAAELFEKYHPPIGELTDRELEDVAGGGCGYKPDPAFKVGDHVARTDAYVACVGKYAGFPCRADYIEVTKVGEYAEIYHGYAYYTRCPKCGAGVQLWESQLRLVNPR